MSETEEKTIEKKTSIVDDNVAALKAKIIGLESLVEELTGKLAKATTELDQAKEFVENDLKKDLLAFIAPRYSMPMEYLVLKSVDELKAIKAVLDKVEIPAFKAGTPVFADKKSTPRQELDSMYSNTMTKLRVEGKL